VQAFTREWLSRTAPELLADPEAFRWYASYIRRGTSPAANKAIRLMNAQIDIRDVLPSIYVPTLVLYRENEYFREGTRYMGEHIPGARVVELPGPDHLPWEGDQVALLDEVERFLATVGDPPEPDRVLATLLFTDIVGSTAKAAALGDRAWGNLLSHYQVVRAQLVRFRGEEVDTAGDGLLATFDGPARAVRCATAIVTAVRTLALRSGPACTPARSNEPGATSGASPFISELVSLPWPSPARFSSRVRLGTSSPGRASASTSEASTS
jgi:hypothetical protein